MAAGTTYFFDRKNYLGLSYASFENTYGVVSEADVDINLKQRRIDLAGHKSLDGFFTGLRVKSAQTFYEHTELEGGETGTIFDNTGNESRVELVQGNKDGWHGILGLQTQVLEYSAQGEEAFLPTTDKEAIALFAFEEIELRPFKFNFGLRGESTNLKAYQGPTQAEDQSANFFTTSAALGGVYSFNPKTSTSFNLSYNERAPTYQELFSNGPHLALGIFEVGESDLEKETNFALEWSIKRKTRNFYVGFTVFDQEFSNFVSLNPSGSFADTDESGTAGDSAEDFEIYNYQSQRARINGAELEVRQRLHAYWSVRFTADYLYGQNLATNEPLPQISPIRLGLSAQFDRKAISSSLSWRNVFEQTRTAPQETPTSSYNLLNFDFNYTFKISSESLLKLYFQVNNIADVKARNHVSLLKDRVLLPGRNFVGGVRWLF
jgi:iron complex outermembrane receptor protein